MLVKSLKVLGWAALTLSASPLAAATQGPPVYQIAMELRDGARLVGSPSLRVAASEPARIEIADGSGDRFAMSITTTPEAGDIVLATSNIDVISGHNHWHLEPKIKVKLGDSAEIAFGEESATAKPFRIAFRVARAN